MPLIRKSSYAPTTFFRNGHAHTILPSAFRRPAILPTERIRIDTPDDDFLDLDYHTDGTSNKVAILSHGLEGCSTQSYIQGMAKALANQGWDTVAWNFRGCSGEANRLLRFYHSGATEDLQAIIDHVLLTERYEKVALIGFSLGGNLTLKYLGDLGSSVDQRIYKSVTFSTPCDLESCSYQLAKPANRYYMWRFMRCLRLKMRNKAKRFPDKIDITGLNNMHTFAEFDEHYTAPLHGFGGAMDYWTRSSCLPVLTEIRIPALLVNARNDPFLGAKCYPEKEAVDHPYFHFEAPDSGGHVGFMGTWPNGEYWSETRTIEFLKS
ncbi:MAG: alpha/beta fold hydrolase [Verrucomicrobia bacterium]|nr:alpha/beta fold hydrolase [Verrucomicrobiota bacterium]